MVFHEKLQNGIRVVFEPLKQYRSIAIGVWIGTGSVFEKDGESGASHFIEHMLFKGTEKRTASDIAAEMDAIGGNINAFTAKECTCFYAKVLDEHLNQATDILSDIVMHSKFDPSDIEREKGVVCEEILMTEDSPEDVAHESLCSLYYDKDTLAKPILGTQKSVRAFSRETLTSYLSRHYGSNNIVISCAGNFRDNSALIDTLNQYFSSMPTGEPSPNIKNKPASARSFKSIKKDIEQVHICMGLPGYSLDEKNQYPLLVLSTALGGSMSSRLFQKIREERGLAYSTYCYPTSYKNTGYFALYAGTGEKQAQTVAQLMMDELENIKKSDITQQELVRAKEQIKGSFILGQEGTSARSNLIGKSELLRGKIYSDDEIINFIENVGIDDIMSIIPQVIDFKRLSATIVGRVNDQTSAIEKLFAGR